MMKLITPASVAMLLGSYAQAQETGPRCFVASAYSQGPEASIATWDYVFERLPDYLWVETGSPVEPAAVTTNLFVRGQGEIAIEYDIECTAALERFAATFDAMGAEAPDMAIGSALAQISAGAHAVSESEYKTIALGQ